MVTIRRADSDGDIKKIAKLADVIWHEHFTPIIGAAQVEYMLEKFQSYTAISSAVKNDGYIYYMAEDAGRLSGYLGAHPENDAVFLSKIYVEKSQRRKGIASKMLDAVRTDFRDSKYMYLTVNRFNDVAVKTYKALGFYVVREQKTEIGDGFVMDDYVFRIDNKGENDA